MFKKYGTHAVDARIACPLGAPGSSGVGTAPRQKHGLRQIGCRLVGLPWIAMDCHGLPFVDLEDLSIAGNFNP